LAPKLDHKRVVQTIGLSNQLPLIQQYLQHVQRENNSVVNEALNSLYVEEENYEALRESIQDFDAFDQIALAQQLQKHDLLEFRRIAASLYKRNQRWTTSINLSKQDGLWQDAMETAAASSDGKLAEELLRFFVETKDCPRSCFAACLYTCYTLIHPDIVLELSWRYGLNEFCMPYMVQTFRSFSDRLDRMQRKIDASEQHVEEQKQKEQTKQQQEVAATANALLNPLNGPLAITYAPNQTYNLQPNMPNMPPMAFSMGNPIPTIPTMPTMPSGFGGYNI